MLDVEGRDSHVVYQGAVCLLLEQRAGGDTRRGCGTTRPFALSRSGEGLRGRATAHQVAVAVGAVDASHGRPHLAVVHSGRRTGGIGGDLTRVRVVPLVG